MYGCTIKQLPDEMLVQAAVTACAYNPANKPQTVSDFALAGFVATPGRLAVLTSKYWGSKGVKLAVGFMDTSANDLRSRILAHMNAWGKFSNVAFTLSNVNPQVRIARQPGGYWSYLGTDILHIPANEQTMNLEGFTMHTPESEFVRVVRHETGHTLGFPHEHMRAAIIERLDVQRTINYFQQTQGWSPQTTMQQVLTPISEGSFAIASPRADETSIMTYQLPASITRDGRPVVGGADINSTDREYAAKMYPIAVVPPPPVEPPKPPEKPVMPSPKEIVDQLFAAVEAYFANKPIVLAVVKLAHQFVLQWLASNPQAAAAVFSQASRQADAGEVDYARMAENLVA